MNVNRQRASGNNRMKNEWWAVGSIAAGTFLLVTTEFLPIGLLSHLSTDLRVSVGVAGLSVTAPGLVAAFMAPPLVLLARTTDRRIVITALTAAIVVSNVVAAVAGNFPVFLSGRLILGLAVGGFGRLPLLSVVDLCRRAQAQGQPPSSLLASLPALYSACPSVQFWASQLASGHGLSAFKSGCSRPRPNSTRPALR
ncbi:MFS transporter [Caballeronia sp. 15711]|uniref:MFS transporter n=1 Tax=Caballeronia sp. 15711 TaxID=3391029 RepID=UPI0039E25662